MGKSTRINSSDLDIIINNLENKGEDASELKAIRNSQGHRSLQPRDSVVDDDEHAQNLMEQSPIEEGDNLHCQVCNSECTKLISGVCETCFRDWALSTRKEN